MLIEKIQTDLKSFLKNHQTAEVVTLRFLLADCQNVKIDKRRELSDEETIEIIQRQIKSHSDSITAFEKGGRPDLVAKEKREAEILQNYLPRQLTDEEISGLIKETLQEVGISDKKEMGKVMGAISPKLKGRADKGRVARLLSKILE
ncbi:glutamyl-tRNA amidotransferase [candidate division WWE3 bacterium CG06_land_8_20_14_3_00_42_16]|uniref:Glutamyl-tRNA amidotransferase n=4 Tax=Katanobacteria TaxID=422282 RepID=A0A2M7ALG9_UNCKA|nr:MAG: glutamyl-tRNA amidotransferase [candidate division WWE3 bacterium CG06_land_8_20_14_3_00_42_16]PIZ43642.1 MAG: glutamyl-tRNA amidotransferase [candidate division WWE3 bacterium CG_4_10_14_0_2_um_filter_42_8]PJA38496.1 MAG: glutamyl-tRNA amidotransferase [candidate division WWE3 bacterium CG_4_9_14_3_um_filter_43_9]PJC68385.1 MAG: glutamyl-tRNA amidotransferase [candidate division WWE3 bacterium CG_4_8_14_3_um_filter_42_11]